MDYIYVKYSIMKMKNPTTKCINYRYTNKMKLIFHITVLWFYSMHSVAQTFNIAVDVKERSGELVSAKLNNGNYHVIFGSTMVHIDTVYPVVFYIDSLGNVDSIKQYRLKCPLLYPVNTNSHMQSNSGFTYFCNCLVGHNEFDWYKIECNNFGDTVSVIKFHENNGTLLKYVYINELNEVYLLGHGVQDYFLQKWVNDSLIWQFTSSLNSPITPGQLFFDGTDIMVIAGKGVRNSNEGSDAYLAKISKDGILLWETIVDLGYSELVANDGLIKYNNGYLLGVTKHRWQNKRGEVTLCYFDSNGVYKWERQIGQIGYYKSGGLLMYHLDGILLRVNNHPYGENNSIMHERGVLYKLNLELEIQWEREYWYPNSIGNKNSQLSSVYILENDQLFTIGVTHAGEGGQDLWAMQLDEYGCLEPGCHLNDVSVFEQANTDVLSEVRLYPNPNNGSFTLSFNSENTKELMFIEIMDYTGKLIYTKQINVFESDNIVLQLPELTNGMYVCRVQYYENNKQHSVIQKLQILK
jgi:hypothetical protein